MYSKNIKISTRLGLGFSMIVTIMAVSTLIAILLLNVVDEKVERVEKMSIPMALMAEDMALNIVQVQQWLTDVSTTHLGEGYVEAEREAEKFRENLKNFKSLSLGNRENGVLDQLDPWR